MNRSYSFRVPASTSNLGAGFDALSLALQRYLKIKLEPHVRHEIVARGVSAEQILDTSENLILRVARSAAGRRMKDLPPFRMTIDNEIPLARGMGSSAAAIIAGITCYELAAQDPLSDQDIFRCAFEFEPHPDNLAAALRGGLVATAVTTAGDVLVARLAVPGGIVPVIVIPAFELSTENARAVLPQAYGRPDVVYNIQRSALTIAALTTGNWSVLGEAMRDRIHQPYRARLIPGLDEILELKTPGLIAVALSGAGPTVLGFAEPEHAEAVGRAIADVFGKHGVGATPCVVEIDTQGRSVEL